MKIRTSLFRPLAVCAAAFIFITTGLAQQPDTFPGRSFDFNLQLVEAGTDGDPKALPDGWDKVKRQIRTDFGVEGFKSIGSFWMRGTTGGSAKYEGIWGNGPIGRFPTGTLIRWSVGRIELKDSAVGVRDVKATLYVPYGENISPNAPLPNPSQYEFAGEQLSFEPNTPAVLASFDLGDQKRRTLLVLTVRPIKN